jgi:hypothetical protein
MRDAMNKDNAKEWESASALNLKKSVEPNPARIFQHCYRIVI